MSNLRTRIFQLLNLDTLFDLKADAQEPEAVVDEVSKNVVFRGTNLWILIFAIVICSVGLNVNSTAVIIGAMLISPLMGPIIGVGVGVGIFDTQLIRKSARNLLIAVVISVASSALYFLISPLSNAQSELLARTTPTLWDVLIAMFGGLAGIVAGTRKEKTNVIPGVAIATALMPPLCTTGYGLATGNAAFFFGALYLFFINAVFISVSAFLIVRLLRFPRHSFVDQQRERRVRLMIGAVVLFTILPSIWLAYTLVERTLFEQKATAFINDEFDLEQTKVLESRLNSKSEQRKIEVFLMGEPIADTEIRHIQERMAKAGLKDARLIVHQNAEGEDLDVNALRSGVLEDLYTKGQEAIRMKDQQIDSLERVLEKAQGVHLPVQQLVPELLALEPGLTGVTLNRNVLYRADQDKGDTALVAILDFKKRPAADRLDRLRSWLSKRCDQDSVVIVVR
ncbi:MAG: TIGR00341 family protein [Flavobacteriales bacterium]|nr:TIGR00341 family protein [Flavobacteriales bacterium]